ncbi:uidA [Mytilus coruscus]|uniref:UidA n=1 Tax=Mytilus coruscus TaxID=42192 RepID=A0A6J8A178_MYTCO|nr:uidA [Mytilus coruscus]
MRHLPFEAEIQDIAKFGSVNYFTVAVDNTLTPTTLPPGETVYKHGNYPPHFFIQNLNFGFFNYAGIDRQLGSYTGTVYWMITTNSEKVKIQVEVVDADSNTVVMEEVTVKDSTSASTDIYSPESKWLSINMIYKYVTSHVILEVSSRHFWNFEAIKDCDTPHHASGNYLTEDLGVHEITENDTIELETSSLKISKDDHIVKSLIDLTPKVVEELRKEGFEDTLLQFFDLISNKKCPFDNIAFLLWTEVIRWFNLEKTSGMRYLKQKKQFWKLGMRLFGGKFIRFMSGNKNTSDVLYGESPPGYFDPSNSDIKFAIPSTDVLREYTHYNDCSGKRLPGIFTDVMQKVSQSMRDQSLCISFDGTKIKQGLTTDSGDVNLLGFEDGLTLQQRKDDLCQLVSALETNIDILKRFGDEASMKCIPVDIMGDVIKELRVFLEVLSTTADIIRKIKVKKEYAKSKFIDRGGSEWRSGKFVYVKSAINAYLYDVI